MVSPAVLSAPSPAELLNLFSASETTRLAEFGYTLDSATLLDAPAFYGPDVSHLIAIQQSFEGDVENYQHRVYTVCTVGETPTPSPETFNWQNQGHLLQALLIVMAVVIFTMGYRAGDKT